MKFFFLVWSNLKRKKLRTALTILIILVAFFLFGLLSALKVALTAGVNMADANRLIVRHRVSFIQMLPHSYRQRIAQIPGVKLISFQVWFGGIYQDPKNQFGSFPVDPEAFFAMNPELTLPPGQMQAWLKTRTGAVVGKKLADRFHWKVGDRIPLTSPIWPNKTDDAWQFDIVGIYDHNPETKKPTDTGSLLFRFDYFDEARSRGEGTIGWFQVRVDAPTNAPGIAKAIDAEFANSSAETKSETEGAMFQGFAQQIGDIGKIVSLIVTAVFFIILLVAGNTMAQSVRERTQEIGVLKALGFSNELVLGVVLGESLLIALLGGMSGLFLGWSIVSVLGKASFMQTYFPLFYIRPQDFLLGSGFALALGTLTGILPALQAMRLRLAEALRREG
jgi:putative ABC transport system permease protein